MRPWITLKFFLSLTTSSACIWIIQVREPWSIRSVIEVFYVRIPRSELCLNVIMPFFAISDLWIRIALSISSPSLCTLAANSGIFAYIGRLILRIYVAMIWDISLGSNFTPHSSALNTLYMICASLIPPAGRLIFQVMDLWTVKLRLNVLFRQRTRICQPSLEEKFQRPQRQSGDIHYPELL